MTSWGGLTDSRLARAKAVKLFVVKTKSMFPPLGVEGVGSVMLSSTPALAGPEDASTAGSHAGWLFHVSALSAHVSSDKEWTSKPVRWLLVG